MWKHAATYQIETPNQTMRYCGDHVLEHIITLMRVAEWVKISKL
jgi:hypothetical protein